MSLGSVTFHQPSQKFAHGNLPSLLGTQTCLLVVFCLLQYCWESRSVINLPVDFPAFMQFCQPASQPIQTKM